MNDGKTDGRADSGKALEIPATQTAGHNFNERMAMCVALASRNGFALDTLRVTPGTWDILICQSGHDGQLRFDKMRTELDFHLGGSWFRVRFTDGETGGFLDGKLIVGCAL